MSKEILATIKRCLRCFSKYSTKPKYDKSNKLVIGKMKDETIGVAIDKFVGLKPKM